MEIVADLHLHSHYSRAVSPQMVIPQMAKWAKIKGINLLGTGDFTHPQWLGELKEYLEEREGVLRLKRNGEDKGNKGNEVSFLLTVEISSIYSQGGKCRRIHNLIFAPSFSTVDKINNELIKRGCNLNSDGRPIIGLSAKNLVKLVLSVDEKCLIVPAHVWTPWFSLYGSKSGFDTIEECFGEFSKNIYAIETGLSSDPEMNWGIRDLDNRQILSFGDSHSLEKLGREATIFEMGDTRILRYEDIRRAIVGEVGGVRGIGGIKYTVEFYPEEGMYHYSGHRKCGIVYGPEEILTKGEICPVCGKGLTIGVVERVRDLSKSITSITGTTGITGGIEIDQGLNWIKKEGRPPFVKLVPLSEIIAESLEVGNKSKKVINEYNRLIEGLGSEFKILTELKLEEIAKVSGEKIAEGIRKVRAGDINISPGYDGEYGKVKVFRD